MKRGEIWTAAGGPGYAGKPGPVAIVQDEDFNRGTSVIVCPITTDPIDLPLIRVPTAPSDTNGLRHPSRLMADKLTSVPQQKLGRRIGELDAATMAELGNALVVILGLASR